MAASCTAAPCAAASAAAARPARDAKDAKRGAVVSHLSSPGSQPSVVLAFVSAGGSELARVPGMSVGIMSASQGLYTPAQLLLDITQGARIAASIYPRPLPPRLRLLPGAKGARVEGWRTASRRAAAAPALLRPGLLAGSIPGGAGYVGVAGSGYPDGALAAGIGGHVAAFSSGSASMLPARVDALLTRKRLVVADLPGGAAGRADLLALARTRGADELLIAIGRDERTGAGQLLWTAVTGLHAEHPVAGPHGASGMPGSSSAGGRELTSSSTNQRGLIASIDIAPTALRRLGLPIPAQMRGASIRTDGPLDFSSLRGLMARLQVISSRRLPALGWLLAAWALLLGLCASVSRLGSRDRHRMPAWALRTGALGVLWAPVAVLVPAALAPGAAAEYSMIALICLALGALTDRLLSWPRALLAPAIVDVVVLTADALAGTQLLLRSLLGPDPILGARFYGIGNGLKSGLAVLVLAAVAAALYPSLRGRRSALTFAGAGALLAVIEGSARIGAGVGGVILVCAGTAVATVMLLPGTWTKRRALGALGAPVLGLVALTAIDLASAHGTGHFTGSVLDARSPQDLRDVVVRRYTAAWDELQSGAMPVATVIALLGAALGVRRRERLLGPVAGDPGWRAALAGGLVAGVVGALVEDSGPVLLVVAVFVLGCVLAYLRAEPPPPSASPPRSPDTSRAARSRARTRPAAPAR